MKMEKKMSEEANIEVEVTDEVTPQDAVRNMMDKWADADNTSANFETPLFDEKSSGVPVLAKDISTIPSGFSINSS